MPGYSKGASDPVRWHMGRDSGHRKHIVSSSSYLLSSILIGSCTPGRLSPLKSLQLRQLPLCI